MQEYIRFMYMESHTVEKADENERTDDEKSIQWLYLVMSLRQEHRSRILIACQISGWVDT